MEQGLSKEDIEARYQNCSNGPDNDKLRGDSWTLATDDAEFIALAYHSDDIDGKEGDDLAIAGGMSDTLWGEASNDAIFTKRRAA